MNEFLNPKSMITPGVAGGLVMLVTNTCASQFDLPAKWVALILSALIAFFVVTAASGRLLQKTFFWIFNSLIIFSMAIGTNQAAIGIATNPAANGSPKESAPTFSATPTSSPNLAPKPFARPPENRSRPFFRSWIDHDGGGRGKM